MDWLEITVSTAPEGIEPVAELIRETGAGGVVIEDPAVILQYAVRTEPEEWAVMNVIEDGICVVKGYLPVDDELLKRVDELLYSIGRLGLDQTPEVHTRVVMEEDWANAWKAYYKPLRIGRRLVIKPPWEDYHEPGDWLVIELDPGMAFGCGTHATTSMCLRLLEKHVRVGMAVYDIGAGSGILSIAAAKLGAGKVVAVDIDPVACRVALENVARNRVNDLVMVEQGNLLGHLEEKADLIVSNIIASVIISFSPDVTRALAPSGIFITSGIISERAEEVRAALEASGLDVVQQLNDGVWSAFAAQKKAQK